MLPFRNVLFWKNDEFQTLKLPKLHHACAGLWHKTQSLNWRSRTFWKLSFAKFAGRRYHGGPSCGVVRCGFVTPLLGLPFPFLCTSVRVMQQLVQMLLHRCCALGFMSDSYEIKLLVCFSSSRVFQEYLNSHFSRGGSSPSKLSRSWYSSGSSRMVGAIRQASKKCIPLRLRVLTGVALCQCRNIGENGSVSWLAGLNQNMACCLPSNVCVHNNNSSVCWWQCHSMPSRNPVGIQSRIRSVVEFRRIRVKNSKWKEVMPIFSKKRVLDQEITHAGQVAWTARQLWQKKIGSRLGNVRFRLEEACGVVQGLAGKDDFGRCEVGGAWEKVALWPERYEEGPCSRSSCVDKAGPGCGVRCLMIALARSLELPSPGTPNFAVVGRQNLCCWLDERNNT